MRFLEIGHPVEIGRALAQDEFHVLHLSGHGGPGVIEDEDGLPVRVTARMLAAEVKRAGRNIPLVFLSSCHGGTADSETASLAVDLVREGVPLVLSRQTRVTDRYASDLSRKLYFSCSTTSKRTWRWWRRLSGRHDGGVAETLCRARRFGQTALHVPLRAAREQARAAYGQALALAERLAQAEPDRADYQRDRRPLSSRSA